MKSFNIETPSEAKIDVTPHSFTPEMVKSVFRDNASVMYIGEIYKGNPAFKDWSQRLTLGEKLPRGKYFRKEERIRALLNTRLDTVKITTFHVQ
ncbi:hypothetical protein GFB57_25625 (plasmid) [Citrobacter sp. S39]|uniref:hypothetical protein n=1 Tax=Citrobacter sp. S39 TaxID=2660638 RepID=UPI0012A934D3|nr:hypothetical protein [Citrobacter sp. S39]QFX91952.1 hypothetical protein GFB57_25625 [Citrobacter sp. S39]HBP7197174.1 hypothetical protein [Salmonella enterica subsp. enterica serovar Infantis]HBP8226466.1 hypothetical protein [Salmonella enterica subsp. enterica serovar Infantis]